MAARTQIIEAAGQVFAEKGRDAATSREICALAEVNAAAVNYHFGGVDALYEQVVEEAHRRATDPDRLVVEALAEASAEVRLVAVLSDMIRRIASPAARSWEVRLLSREFIAPSSSDAFIEAVVKPQRLRMRTLLAAVLGCDPNDPRAGHALLFVISPCLVLAVAKLLPAQSLTPDLNGGTEDEIEGLIAHFRGFVTAGLRAFRDQNGAGSSETKERTS